jgi:hypothetical protein
MGISKRLWFGAAGKLGLGFAVVQLPLAIIRHISTLHKKKKKKKRTAICLVI